MVKMVSIFRLTWIGILSILLCEWNNSFGQVTISDFLRSANDAAEVKVFEEQVNYLQGKPYRLSPLQKLEFRTKNNQLDPSLQDYAIRISPANPWEIRSTNNYFKEYQASLFFRARNGF